MKKKLRDIVAKRCVDFDSRESRKRRSKRLKSLSVGLATTEDGNDGEMNEREGDNITNKLFVDQSQDFLPVVGKKPPNIRDNLDSTHMTPRSPLPSDSLASLALLKLASRGQVSPILDRSQNVGELVNVCEPSRQQLPKKRRGPTKTKPIAIEECNKVGVTFDQFGQPIEEASIGLSSFLGPLVREVVPVTLSDWRKLSTRSKEILWTSIQFRYNVKEDWQRKCIFQKMGRLWRAEKSRILSQIQSTSTNEELVKMKPSNIQSVHDWMEFVKEKKSTRFKAKSEKFKSMKEMQLPSTRRKSYTRLAEEMAMQNKLSDNVAKRCIDFDSKAPRKRRSKRLKFLSIDLATTEDVNDGEINSMEGVNITNKLFVDQSQDSLPVAGNERPNIGDNLDSTHTTPESPLPSDSLASLTLLKLASRGQVSPILDRSQNVGEHINDSEPTMQQHPKKRRGPTKMKPIAIEECNKVDITFDQFGQPIGEASIGLSSFLGALVREVVPVTLSNWRKLSTTSKEILWTSIQGMEKKLSDMVAKRCIYFDPKTLQKRRSKRLESFSIGPATTEDDNDGKMNKEGDNITNKFFIDQSQNSMAAGNKAPNIGDNHDSTHTIPSSPLPLDSDSTDRTPSSPLSLDRSQNSGEHINVSEQTMQQLPNNCRDPTRMGANAIEECNKVDIIFNEFGQPIGEASIGLSSFLGPLVREVVPVTLNDWRKLSTRSKEVLWKSVQLRYNMKEDWQRKYIFQKMGRLWRAGKSRIVSQIQSTSTSEELVKMKPSNIKSMHDWMNFVKEKKSAMFKAKSEKFKSMKKKQLPHTCSRKGYARLAEEMKKGCPDSSSVSRVAVWAKAHRKKDGNPVNSQVAEALERIEQIDNEGIKTTSNNVGNEAISKVLGSDRGDTGALGFGVTVKKFSLLSQLDGHYAELEETNDNEGIITGSNNVINDAISKVLGPDQGGALGFGVTVKKFSQREHYTKLEEKYKKMEGEMSEMRSLMSQILKSQGNGSEHLSNATNEQIVNNVATNPIGSSPLSINDNNALPKCKMLDWCGTGEVVAEGRWSSNDPKVIVHHVPLGPQAVKVWVDLPKRSDAFLWRPNSEMHYIKDAVGSAVAWPLDKVVMSMYII
ncbi:uncharacterized protein LOC101217008 isoform X8 [Cucumis sativus]|uniref:uncharacterized protein LOC101217008 isoform X8 n=1 Tax=Cucumis sativus TaxID=3659 RepID=UPI0012F528AF|nr:uncharacterized protein LOC101217008 isoform X8 [Cucumis sativus]